MWARAERIWIAKAFNYVWSSTLWTGDDADYTFTSKCRSLAMNNYVLVEVVLKGSILSEKQERKLTDKNLEDTRNQLLKALSECWNTVCFLKESNLGLCGESSAVNAENHERLIGQVL